MMFLWVIRFFVFNLYESPKYLMGRGRDEQAVEVVHKVAAYNGKTSNLTLEDLQRAGKLVDAAVDNGVRMDTSAVAAVRRKMGIFSNNHVKSLFATRKMALSTTILIILWGKSASRGRWLEYRLMSPCSFLQLSSASRFRCKFVQFFSWHPCSDLLRYNSFVTYL
jgi:hypothetical protein